MNLLKLFTGNANPALAAAVAQYLDIEIGKAHVGTFSDGEVNVEIQENVRGCDCFVLQPTCAPANTNLMELLIMVDALRRSSARRITAVIPYYGYARQDRKVRPRLPISAKLVADLISTARAPTACSASTCTPARSRASSTSRSTTCSRRRCCSTRSAIATAASRSRSSRPTPAAWSARAPTPSASTRASRSSTSAARPPTSSQVMNIIGDVQGRTCVIVDDIVDTAGTLTEAATRAQGRGRRRGLGRDHAPRALRARDQAHPRVAADRARGDRHHPAAPRGGRLRSRSAWSASRICLSRRSAASTTKRA